jgi:hypothetical protein
MASINATTSSGIVATADNTGQLQLQSAGTTIATITPTGLTTQVGAPAFSAYKNSGNQSLTSATFAKITFDTEIFDTNNNFASSTFTPTVAGYYQISAGASTSGSGTLSRVILLAYKNGSGIYTFVDLGISSIQYRYSGSCLIYCNGSTDYIDIYAYLTGTSPVIESGLNVSTGYNTWVTGFLARSA